LRECRTEAEASRVRRALVERLDEYRTSMTAQLTALAGLGPPTGWSEEDEGYEALLRKSVEYADLLGEFFESGGEEAGRRASAAYADMQEMAERLRRPAGE